MKIVNITKLPKLPLLEKIERGIKKTRWNLRSLVKDVFEKNPAEKKEIPSFIWGPDDYKGTKIIQLKFYPEDIKKMEKMSYEERILFKKQLMEQKRYSEGDIVGTL